MQPDELTGVGAVGELADGDRVVHPGIIPHRLVRPAPRSGRRRPIRQAQRPVRTPRAPSATAPAVEVRSTSGPSRTTPRPGAGKQRQLLGCDPAFRPHDQQQIPGGRQRGACQGHRPRLVQHQRPGGGGDHLGHRRRGRQRGDLGHEEPPGLLGGPRARWPATGRVPSPPGRGRSTAPRTGPPARARPRRPRPRWPAPPPPRRAHPSAVPAPAPRAAPGPGRAAWRRPPPSARIARSPVRSPPRGRRGRR
jgi:hypothetical protein